MAVTDLDLGRYKLGWPDEDDYVYKPKKGLNEDVVHEISLDGRASPSGCEVPPQGAEALRAQADGPVVREEHARHRLRRHLLLPQAHRGAGRRLGQAPRGDEGAPTRSSASPRPSASSSPASPRSTSPRSCTTRTARTSRRRASSSPTWTPRCASTPRSSSSTSARSSRRATTSSPRSTRPCGRAARSSTCRRA